MTGWARLSTGNCARSSSLVILTNSICTTLNLSWRMRRTNSSGIWHKNGSPNLGQTTRSHNNQQKKKKKKKKKRKKTCRIVNFAVPADHRVKLKESEKRDRYLELTSQLKKKLWSMKVTIIPIVIGNNGTGGDCPNNSIIEIVQNTEKSPRDLRRLTVTRTPVKDHPLTVMWKILKE